MKDFREGGLWEAVNGTRALPSSVFCLSEALTSAVSQGQSVDLSLALATRRHCWKPSGRMREKSQYVQLLTNEMSLSV